MDFDEEAHLVEVDATGSDITEEALTSQQEVRHLSLSWASTSARVGSGAKVSMPGVYRIGSRPIDLHLKGLKAMGAD